MYFNKLIEDKFEISEKGFQTILKKKNRIGYHVGSYLWKKQLEKGNSLKDLVIQGNEGIEEWMRERDDLIQE